MKKISLKETWRLCLNMWRWIAMRKKGHDRRNVKVLKKVWLKRHGYKKDEIESDCFFCHYDKIHDGWCCYKCPGEKVDESFNCHNSEYDYYRKPLDFYEELKRLNRKRQGK